MAACGADPQSESEYVAAGGRSGAAGESSPDATRSSASDAGGALADMGTAGPTADAGETGTAGLLGVWAQRQVTVSDVDVPVVGTTRTPTVSLLRVEISPGRAPGLRALHLQICGISLGSDADLARTLIPDAFVDALPEVDREASLGEDGTYTVEWLTQVHGARLEDPEADMLPTALDDPRVFDQDGDGHPGLTVRIGGLVDGEIYVVQRGRDRLSGRFADDRVDGRLEWTSEQVVLGADVDLLEMPVPTHPVADPAAHVFALRRLPADADCEFVLAHATELFEP